MLLMVFEKIFFQEKEQKINKFKSVEALHIDNHQLKLFNGQFLNGDIYLNGAIHFANKYLVLISILRASC